MSCAYSLHARGLSLFCSSMSTQACCCGCCCCLLGSGAAAGLLDTPAGTTADENTASLTLASQKQPHARVPVARCDCVVACLSLKGARLEVDATCVTAAPVREPTAPRVRQRGVCGSPEARFAGIAHLLFASCCTAAVVEHQEALLG